MTKADLQREIDAVQQRSVAMYLRRQEIELARQQIQQQSTQCEMEMLKLDGALETLTALMGKATE